MNLALTKPTAKEEVDAMRDEAFKDRKTLTIAVEGKDDVAFWSFVFDRSVFRGTYRIFRSYNYPKADSSGKNNLANFLPHTQRDFAICIDSDYDYLLEDRIWQRPFVFQTYTYSIENYYCYVPSLNAVMNRAANLASDTEGYSFDDIFIRQFSGIIYEPMIESLQESINMGRNREARHKLGQNIRLTSGATTDIMLSNLSQNIQRTIQHLPVTDDFRQRLAEKGLTPETTYLFARGKDVLNSVFLPILKPIREEKRTNRRRELDALADTNAQRAYTMGVMDVKRCLLENRGFTDCFLFQKIEADIQSAFR